MSESHRNRRKQLKIDKEARVWGHCMRQLEYEVARSVVPSIHSQVTKCVSSWNTWLIDDRVCELLDE